MFIISKFSIYLFEKKGEKKMIKERGKIMKRAAILVIWVISLVLFLYLNVTSVDFHVSSFAWGAVFGLLSAILVYSIRNWYDEIKSEDKKNI